MTGYLLRECGRLQEHFASQIADLTAVESALFLPPSNTLWHVFLDSTAGVAPLPTGITRDVTKELCCWQMPS